MRISLRYIVLFAALCTLMFSASSFAQTKIHVQGAGRLYPVAAPVLCTISKRLGKASRKVPSDVRKALDYSGYFSVIRPDLYIESEGKCGLDFAYSDWSIINTEGLVKGEIDGTDSDLTVRLYLHDVAKQQIVLAKEYRADISQLTSIAHRFTNEVIGYFTGSKGVFGSKIAYSSKIGRFKELFLIDMDGSNQTQITYDKALALSASWSPLGNEIVFTSYRNRMPDLFAFNLHNKQFRQITRSLSLEIGAKYNEYGNAYLLSLSHGRESDLVQLSKDGKITKFITQNNGTIEVSPAYSPDYRKIAFVSNRSGGPQIYVMDADGGKAKRISYVRSKYCTSPSWAPDGSKIAFVCRADGGFQIFTSNIDGSGAFQLTSLGSNEDPSWSPDGRHIVFSSTYWQGARFSLALMRNDGSNLRRLTRSRTGDTDPDWGPVL